MSGYVYNEYGGRKRKKRSMFVVLADGVMFTLSVVTAAGMLLTYMAPYVNPASIWIFSILGLVAPAVYVATVILALYWIIRWRRIMASVMTVLVVIGLFKVSLFFGIDFKRDYGEQKAGRGVITVMTYNVRAFYGDDNNNSADSVVRLIKAVDPDILCMQEVNYNLKARTDFDSLMSDYSVAIWKRDGGNNQQASPLLIYAKFPILRAESIVGQNALDPNGRSMWADVVIGGDTLRIFNNHLHSTAITAADNEFLSNRILSDTASEVKLRSIVRRFRDNSILRAAQADTISDSITVSPYVKIVCGDFNDTPMSYVYRKMSTGLEDSFCESGKGMSHTYRGFFNTLRIDYVLYSRQLECLSYEVLDRISYSDHHPVVVRLKYKQM